LAYGNHFCIQHPQFLYKSKKVKTSVQESSANSIINSQFIQLQFNVKPSAVAHVEIPKLPLPIDGHNGICRKIAHHKTTLPQVSCARMVYTAMQL
jgi:hypothetical protein